MLIRAQHLVDRLRQPRSRADEVLRLRQRLSSSELRRGDAGLRELAMELRRLRVAVADAQGRVEACGSCSRGRPLPSGRWSGGHCCSGATDEIFSEDELAALALSRTVPAMLRAPAGDHAGCAFRAGSGCSIDAADRTNLCLRYVCGDLTREVAGRGDIAPLMALVDQLDETWARFVAARRLQLSVTMSQSSQVESG